MPVLQGALRGRLWIVGASVHGCWLGSFELDKQALFCEYVRPGMVVYDIGANVGFYSLLAARLSGPRGAVYAFEPLPRNLGFLRRHVRLNRAQTVTVVDAALSDHDGEAYFADTSDPSSAHLSAEPTGLTVRALSLDSFRAREGLASPALLKIDAEGAEGKILQGAERTIREGRPVIFLATHEPGVHEECCTLLRAWGYELRPIGGADIHAAGELVALPPAR